MLWVLVFKVVAPLGCGELTAGTAIINIVPDDLAKYGGARRRVEVLEQPGIETHCGKIASAVTF